MGKAWNGRLKKWVEVEDPTWNGRTKQWQSASNNTTASNKNTKTTPLSKINNEASSTSLPTLKKNVKKANETYKNEVTTFNKKVTDKGILPSNNKVLKEISAPSPFYTTAQATPKGTITAPQTYKKYVTEVSDNQNKYKQLLQEERNQRALTGEETSLNKIKNAVNEKTTLGYQQRYNEVQNSDKMNWAEKYLLAPLRGVESMFLKDRNITDEKGNKYSLPTYVELEQNKAISESKGLGKVILSAEYEGGKILTSAALNAVAPGLGNFAYNTNMFVDQKNSAMQEGYSDRQSTVYATIGTAVEYATGKLLGGTSKAVFGETSELSKNIQFVLKNVIKNPRINSFIANATSEGLEEFLQEWIDGVNKYLTLDNGSSEIKEKVKNNGLFGLKLLANTKLFTKERLQDALLSAGVGALTGGVTGGISPDTNINTTNQKNVINTTTNTQLEAQNKTIEQQTNDSNINMPIQQKTNNTITPMNNKLIKVYHGTNAEFDTFDNSKQNYSGWLSKGTYFTKDIETAKNYGKNIKEVYLDLKNPLILQQDKINDDGTVDFAKSTKEQIYEKFPETRNMKWQEVSNFLKEKGYDGIDNGIDISVFDTKSIKNEAPTTQQTNKSGINDQIKRELDKNPFDLKDKYKDINLNEDISSLDGVPAVELNDGTILPMDQNTYKTHVQFIKDKGIDVNDIKSGGWIGNGNYEPTYRSDTQRYIEQKKAEQRIALKRASNLNIPIEQQVDNTGKQVPQDISDKLKDSKVRDDKGNLLEVYHGTPYGTFETFEKGKNINAGTMFGNGFYFTPNKSEAVGYSKSSKNPTKERVYTANLNIVNPLDLNNYKGEFRNNLDIILNNSDVLTKPSKDIIERFENTKSANPNIEFKQWLIYDLKYRLKDDGQSSFNLVKELTIENLQNNGKDLTDLWKEMGYDGLISPKGNEIVAFEPEQIIQVDKQSQPTTTQEVVNKPQGQIEDISPMNNYEKWAKSVSKNKNELANELLIKNYNYEYEAPKNENDIRLFHGTEFSNYDDLSLQDFNETTMDRNYGDYFYLTNDKEFARIYGNNIAEFHIPKSKVLTLNEYREKFKGISDEELFKKYWALEMPDNEYIVKNIDEVKKYTKENVLNKISEEQPTTTQEENKTSQDTTERLRLQKETNITNKYNKTLQKDVKEATKDLSRVLYFNNVEQKEKFRDTLEYYIKDNKNTSLENIKEDIERNFSEKIVKNIDEDLRNIKKEVRNYKIKVSDTIKSSIADYNDFRKSNFGRLTLTKDGTDIDVIYDELSRKYPNIFDGDIINAEDQLLRISDFMNEDITSAEKYNLSESSIDEAANYIKSFIDNKQNLDELINNIEISSKEVRKAKNEEYRNRAKELIANIRDWKDKPRGINYSINTMERNFRDIIPNKSESDSMIKEYITPITESNAKVNKFINSYNETIKELNLNDKESTAVQMYGEYKYNPETELTGLQVEKYIESNNLDLKKIKDSVEVFRNIYDDLILEINGVLKQQGYKEIPYRKGYFPHFINDKQTSIIKKFAEKVGWKFKNMDLPTDIAGMTDIFTPGKTWFRNALQRTGKATDYNALEGFDNYIRGAADIIYHTENIQKLRNLENEIRYQYSDKGIQEEVDKINEDDSLSLEDKEDKINMVYDRISNQMPNLVTELRQYTNGIANKKDIGDRSMEQKIGREAYNAMNNIQSRLSGNMIGLNISSALTNFIPLTQAYSQISTKNMIKAAEQTVKSYLKDDGFNNASVFLTNRNKQPDRLYKTGVEKASDIAGLMFKGIDNLTSNIIVRGKYLQNIENGMNNEKALSNADQFAKNVMAGRDKGSMPTMFNQKNPIVKLFTAFQLEVNNQYGYMFKDLPDDLKKEGIAKLVMAFAKMFFGAWIYNKLKETLTGTKSAFSPIDIIEDTVKTSTNKNLSGAEKITKIGENVARELPFVGGLLGGGRLPISAALPNATKTLTSASNLISGEGNQKVAANTLKQELMKPVAYLVLPFGGGQIKKTVEGLSMYNKEVPGSYTASGKLRFPVKKDLGNKIKSGIFGQYSSKEAREYFDNNYTPLGDKQIKEYKDLKIPIKEYWEYREKLSDTDKVKDKVKLITNLPYSIKQQNIMVNNVVNRKEKIDLSDYSKYGSYEEFDFATKNKDKYNALKELGVSYKEYTKNKEEYDYAVSNPIKYKMSKYIADYSKYKTYKDKIKEVKIGTTNKKSAVINYVNSLSLSIPQKAMLIKDEYSSFDNYNKQIVEYINSQKISKDEKTNILKELGFYVSNGKVRW